MSRKSEGPLVSARAVAKFFGSKLVFKEVSLDVAPGEVWLVVGRNGAGKSTLLRILAGLIGPDAGKVERFIKPGRAGFLGHETFLYPGLTAVENLSFWCSLYDVDAGPGKIEEALARVELSAAAEEKAGGFSRGMAQRLSLARVFLAEPELLYLDEPGTGLDAKSMSVLDAEIGRARERETAVVMVSHHLARDLPLADKVLFLSEKRAAYAGPAADFVPGEGIC